MIKRSKTSSSGQGTAAFIYDAESDTYGAKVFYTSDADKTTTVGRFTVTSAYNGTGTSIKSTVACELYKQNGSNVAHYPSGNKGYEYSGITLVTTLSANVAYSLSNLPDSTTPSVYILK